MTKRRHTSRHITKQEERESLLSSLLSTIISQDSEDAFTKAVSELSEMGEPRTFTIEFLPFRAGNQRMTMIAVYRNDVVEIWADTAVPAIEVWGDTSVPLNEMGIPPNFSYRLLRTVLDLLRRERTLAVADEVLQTPAAVEEFRKSVMNHETAYINERLGVSRGGSSPKWTNEKCLEFLNTYENVEKRVSAAFERYSGKDAQSVRAAMLRAANNELPAGESLPKSIIDKIATPPGQQATPYTSELALELAAREFGIGLSSYLPKVLTRARKLRGAKRSH